MAAIALTDSLIRTLPTPPKGNRIYYDTALAGFGVQVTAAGNRSFVLRYRVRGPGRERQYTIGAVGVWSTASARKEARRLKQLISRGEDPLGKFQAEREAPTVADLIKRFDEEHVGPRLRVGSANAYRSLLRKHVAPFFGKHARVADVGFEDIDALHQKASKTAPYAANRVFDICHKMFELSILWHMRDDNPCRGIIRNLEEKRQRHLEPDELPRLIETLTAYPDQQVANIVRLCLLTGARSGEIMAMSWSGVDLTVGKWSKTASSTKQKKAHVVPLSAPVRQLLAVIQARQPRGCPWVFPSDKNRTGHVISIEHSWAAICKSAGIEGLRIHDLRHSTATYLASGGASLVLIGQLLGHSSPATTARYSHLLDDPQRRAIEQVGAVITNAGSEGSKPLQLKRGHRHGR